MKYVYKFYKRFVSPILVLTFGHACRFEPTCSTYGYLAVKRHGIVKGGFLAFKRIVKCHPFTPPSYDPVV